MDPQGWAGLRQVRWGWGFVLGLAIALMLGLGAGARANMANPAQPGDLLSEPWADVATLAIRHEDLRLDLRPLDRGQRARIQATYHLHNPGAAATVPLLFVAPSLDSATVMLNGTQPIPATATAAPTIPPEWASEVLRAPAGLEFVVPLPSGDSTLTVAYAGLPSSDDAGVYRAYTLDYWLAPARQWQSFGTLTVDVLVPPAWRTDLEPALPQVAPQHWRHTFDSLPADLLTVTTYPVVGPLVAGLRLGLRLGGLAVAVGVTGWLYYRLGRLSQGQGWSGGGLVLTFLLAVPLSVPLMWGLGGLGVVAAESLLVAGRLGMGYGYARMVLLVLAGLATVPVGLGVASGGFVLGRVRHRPSRRS